MLSITALAMLFQMGTGERLANRPAVSWCLLGLVWWTCLEVSTLGFLLTAGDALRLLNSAWKAYRKRGLSDENDISPAIG